jgi:N-acetylglucosamine kinase-like BadF-type ATPase
MADVAQQLLEAMESLDDVAYSITADEAVEELDEATLQLFWRDWPRIQSWAGSLWRRLNDELAEMAGPAGGDVDTGGGD